MRNTRSEGILSAVFPARVEVIEAITRAAFVKPTKAEQIMIARASEAEHQAAAVAVYHATEAKRLLEEMGILRAPGVLDATRVEANTALDSLVPRR